MAFSPNPTPPNAPGVGWGRNLLALVSFLLSLVFPIGLLLVLLVGRGFIATVGPATPLWYSVGKVLEIVGIPALIAAIVIGHMVLGRANRDSLQPASEVLAMVGLGLGYLSLVLFLGVVGLIIWYLTHPINLHFVF
jgi:hypothetical protein